MELLHEIDDDHIRRSQRDLRRLRRDLGYDTPSSPAAAAFYDAIEYFPQPSMYGQRAVHPNTNNNNNAAALRGRELEQLLQGVNFLEQLALINQENQAGLSPSHGRRPAPSFNPSAVAQPRRPYMHAPPSR